MVCLQRCADRNRNRLTVAHRGLIWAVADRGTWSGVESGDIEQEGSLALMRAVERFDVRRGYRFSTYARRAIRNGLVSAARRVQREAELLAKVRSMGHA